ncbi:hypothetical protein PMM47T1_07421 [Pseudomonas sp. M47T1]|uniref:hypothetical protein n=1 Tax=unclassified Pseudomonas TaxID=196821 RepID=UPI000260675D|nr:hypothetical protein [Pseudomonas sp. M47T1]EIK97597.1 hypothetical protein PMM47T1_07421 [Pseudomonas sp. M47T1]
MSRQCLTHLSISSQQVQQGLSVTLALMITLLAGQAYQHWHDSHEAQLAQARPAISYQHFNAVSSNGTHLSQDQAMLRRAESSDQMVRHQSWVF